MQSERTSDAIMIINNQTHICRTIPDNQTDNEFQKQGCLTILIHCHKNRQGQYGI